MHLIEALERVERLLRGETQHDVRIPLELREVVCLRHRLGLLLRRHRDHAALPVLPCSQLLSCGVIGEPDRVLLRIVRCAEEPEVPACSVVVPALEGLDLILALRHQRKRRRLDPSRGELCIVEACERPCHVHADIPVGSGAACGRLVEIVVIRGWVEVLEAFLDRPLRLR